MAHDQEVVGSNLGNVYWMYVSNLLAIILHYIIRKFEYKGSQMGHIKKKKKKKKKKIYNVKYKWRVLS
jgi:hypothetical protein